MCKITTKTGEKWKESRWCKKREAHNFNLANDFLRLFLSLTTVARFHELKEKKFKLEI
jgi:hypothetical protein